MMNCPWLTQSQNPVEMNVNGMGPSLFAGVVGKDIGSGVVDKNRCWWLGMAKSGVDN